MNLLDHIRSVPDFPKPGIHFRDLTPLFGHPEALREAVERLAAPWRGTGVTKVVGVEARGFIVGAPVAIRLGAGFVPVRKPGKLPWTKAAQSYALEYGTGNLEMHVDAVGPTDRVLVVDDLLATGGTAAATVALVSRAKATVVGAAFLVELLALSGRKRLKGLRVESGLQLP